MCRQIIYNNLITTFNNNSPWDLLDLIYLRLYSSKYHMVAIGSKSGNGNINIII